MMGLTESARHLPPLGTEEALRPLSRRSAECRHVFNSDTAPCHSMLGSLQAAFSCIVARPCETAWPLRGVEEPPVWKGCDRYIFRGTDPSRRMLRKSAQDVA